MGGIKPDWRILKDNQVEYYDESYAAQHKIETAGIYYIVDVNRHVHLCEFAPSIELWPALPFVSFTEDPPEDSEIASDIELEIMSSEDICTYIHASDFAKYPSEPLSDYFDMPERDFEDYPDTEEGDEAYRRHCIESAQEYLMGNPCGF